MREIFSGNPMATFIPEQYGGRGGFIRESLELASAANYESLPLSLGFGINCAGLTGWADYWVITARKDAGYGNLARDMDFFVCDVSAPDQNIVVEEYSENLGIYMLPYGRNRFDVKIPGNQKLTPDGSGIRMLDLVHRSRMQFPGMGMGFLARMLD